MLRQFARVAAAVTFVSAVSSIAVVAIRPDVESLLAGSLPGFHMPDAFTGLNEVVPFWLCLGTVTLAIATWGLHLRLPRLLIPLLAGPIMCIAGWLMTNDFADPNWYHLFALSALGMLVSCLVTTALILLGLSGRAGGHRVDQV